MHTLQVNQQLVAKISDYGMSHLRKTAQGAEHTVKPIWTAPEVNVVLSSDIYQKHHQSCTVAQRGLSIM